MWTITYRLLLALMPFLFVFDGFSQQLATLGAVDRQMLTPPNVSQIPLETALSTLANFYNVHIVYDDAVVEGKMAPRLATSSQGIQEALALLIGEEPLTYTKVGLNTIVLTPSEQPSPAVAVNGAVSGRVLDERGEPVSFAQVYLDGTTLGDAADVNGAYSIENVPPGSYTIIASFIGYKKVKADITVTADETVSRDFTMVADLLSMEEIVVTGVQNPKSKLESSVAITTLNARQIDEKAPLSTADLLKSIPGFLVESSGGEVGNNLFARGIPAAGAYEFVQIQEDGLPVFEDGALQFANADNWLRVDETVDRMESVRGGSGSIFASNAPGGIINFISKTGGSEFVGSGKLSVGDYGMFRTDLDFGGPLNDRLRYNIGGFFRYDDGIRSPGFPANRGGQLKANLTYLLDDGYVRAYFKKLDDRNLFLLPIPLQNPSDPEEILGFDANHGTFATVNASKLKVPQFGGGFFGRDLENGIHPVLDALGGEASKDLGHGFSVRNSFRRTNINLDYTALFPGAPPTPANDFAANFAPFGRNLGVSNPVYTYADDGSPANPALVAEVGFWAIDKQMQSFANNLQFTYENSRHSVAGGYYFGSYTSDQQWNWSNILLEIADDARLLNLADGDKSPGDKNYSRTMDGVTEISWLTREAQTRGKINSVYLNDVFKATDQLSIDAGLRYEVSQYRGFKANSDFFAENLGDSTTTADDFITVTGGPKQYWKYGDDLASDPNDDNVDRFSFSVGANYAFDETMAAYARVSNGFRSPIEEAYFDNVGNFANIKPVEVTQLELGFKYTSAKLAIFANGFYMTMNNIAFTDILADGTSENKFAGADNIGLEIETIARVKNFGVNFSGTLQKPEFNDFGANTGNQVRRIPNVFFTLRPSYQLTEGLQIYGSWSYFGKKFSDNGEQFELPSYSVLNAGASYQFNNMRFALDATNLSDTVGLTEGNPRSNLAPGQFFMARPILGRTVRGSVSFNLR